MGLFDTVFGKLKTESLSADVNPTSTDILIQYPLMQYSCPICSSKNMVKFSDFKPIVGLNAVCSGCKNICHIPSGYSQNIQNDILSVTGCVKVPISQFVTWYANHRLVKQGDDKYHSEGYGLWAFCSKCYHAYSIWAITTFPAAQSAEGFFGSAANPQSAEDIKAYVELIELICELEHSSYILFYQSR